MYGRDYNGKTLNFEASGGLIHSSLVMQDDETDSYWAIMTGESVAGRFKGTKLEELSFGKKMTWRDWKTKHPDTVVLSVNGKEDGRNPYRDYFRSPRGFRDSSAKDKRLKTKTPIFAFRYSGQDYATPLDQIEEGATFDLGEARVFLYRPKNAEMFYSTLAFVTTGSGFSNKNGEWQELDSGCLFDPGSEDFGGENCATRLHGGFDTFWYNWSLNNPGTLVLK